MKKSIFLLIFFLLAVQFWGILPLAYYLTPDVSLIALLLWSLLGVKLYGQPNRRRNPLWKSKYYSVATWMFVAAGLSFITCNLYWNQSIIQSVITSRQLYWYLTLPALLIIRPQEKEIVHSLEIFSVIYLIVFLLNSYAPVTITIGKLNFLAESNGVYFTENDFGRTITGVGLILYPLYYRIQGFIRHFNFKDFILAFLWLAIIFVVQNRSTLFIACLVYGYGLIRFKAQHKAVMMIFAVIFGFVLFSITQNILVNLIEETQGQFDDPDYARNKAYRYFLFECSPNLACDLFGNGPRSAAINAELRAQLDEGINNNDVGFVGMWSVYGIIPVIIALKYLILALRKRTIPFYVKAIALSFIIAIPTTSFFIVGVHLINFVLFIYLFAYYSERQDKLCQS